MRLERICWPSSRGFINSCTKYANKDRNIAIIREPMDQGVIIKRIDSDKNNIIKRIATYISNNGKLTKTIE